MFGSERANLFSDEEVGFLTLVANQVAIAFDDALSFEKSQCAAELQRERDRLKLVLDLNNILVSNLDLQEVLRAISANVRRVMQCDSAGVALVDSNSNHLRLYALDAPDGKGVLRERDVIAIENSPYASIWETGKPVVFHGRDLAQNDPLAVIDGLHSLCLIPLTSRTRILGILGLGRLRDEPFTQNDVDFLSQVGVQVAIGVENAFAYSQIIEVKNKLTQERLYLEEEIRAELNLDEIVGESGALRQASRYVTGRRHQTYIPSIWLRASPSYLRKVGQKQRSLNPSTAGARL